MLIDFMVPGSSQTVNACFSFTRFRCKIVLDASVRRRHLGKSAALVKVANEAKTRKKGDSVSTSHHSSLERLRRKGASTSAVDSRKLRAAPITSNRSSAALVLSWFGGSYLNNVAVMGWGSDPPTMGSIRQILTRFIRYEASSSDSVASKQSVVCRRSQSDRYPANVPAT